jgi:hypothetical protein
MIKHFIASLLTTISFAQIEWDA